MAPSIRRKTASTAAPHHKVFVLFDVLMFVSCEYVFHDSASSGLINTRSRPCCNWGGTPAKQAESHSGDGSLSTRCSPLRHFRRSVVLGSGTISMAPDMNGCL